jgi:hypothetical protein
MLPSYEKMACSARKALFTISGITVAARGMPSSAHVRRCCLCCMPALPGAACQRRCRLVTAVLSSQPTACMLTRQAVTVNRNLATAAT